LQSGREGDHNGGGKEKKRKNMNTTHFGLLNEQHKNSIFGPQSKHKNKETKRKKRSKSFFLQPGCHSAAIVKRTKRSQCSHHVFNGNLLNWQDKARREGCAKTQKQT